MLSEVQELLCKYLLSKETCCASADARESTTVSVCNFCTHTTTGEVADHISICKVITVQH